MITQIIPADWHEHRKLWQKDGENFLNVSEFFCDTIQGEGINIGFPAAFLRLQGCHLNCNWCDTKEVWRYGSSYTFNELFDLMDSADLPNKLKAGQHLVITGGSPLLQQDHLYQFILAFYGRYQFKPYIEIENECAIFPNIYQLQYIDCWNNSPKLENSGLDRDKRYDQQILQLLSNQKNSWFKFVVSKSEDWKEIEVYYLQPGLIKKEQIILMPEGASKDELQVTRLTALSMAIDHNVRFTDRLQIWLWNKAKGC